MDQSVCAVSFPVFPALTCLGVSRVTALWFKFPLLKGRTAEALIRKLSLLPLVLYMKKKIRVLCKCREGNMCRQVTNPWNLPIVRSWNVLMILNRADTVNKGSISSIIDVENGSSSESDDLGHHVHHYVALRTQFNAIPDFRIACIGQHLFMELV